MNDIMYRHNASHINASISTIGSTAHLLCLSYSFALRNKENRWDDE